MHVHARALLFVQAFEEQYWQQYHQQNGSREEKCAERSPVLPPLNLQDLENPPTARGRVEESGVAPDDNVGGGAVASEARSRAGTGSDSDYSSDDHRSSAYVHVCVCARVHRVMYVPAPCGSHPCTSCAPAYAPAAPGNGTASECTQLRLAGSLQASMRCLCAAQHACRKGCIAL